MADLTSVSAWLWTALTVSVSSFESVPAALAVATLVTEPLFRSACVIV